MSQSKMRQRKMCQKKDEPSGNSKPEGCTEISSTPANYDKEQVDAMHLEVEEMIQQGKTDVDITSRMDTLKGILVLLNTKDKQDICKVEEKDVSKDEHRDDCVSHKTDESTNQSTENIVKYDVELKVETSSEDDMTIKDIVNSVVDEVVHKIDAEDKGEALLPDGTVKAENVTVVIPYTERNKNTQGDTLQVVETEKPPDDVKVHVPPMDDSKTQDDIVTGVTVPEETESGVTVAEQADMSGDSHDKKDGGIHINSGDVQGKMQVFVAWRLIL